MKWYDIIKMPPNPFGGTWSELTREQYYELDTDEKRLYHISMENVFSRHIDELRRTYGTDIDPTSAIYTELESLQEELKFHRRQKGRIIRVQQTDEFSFFYYDLEAEAAGARPRRPHIGMLTPTGAKRARRTKEDYENMSDKEKARFHSAAASRAQKSGDKKLATWHQKMRHRSLKSDSPTYYSQEDDPEGKDEEE